MSRTFLIAIALLTATLWLRLSNITLLPVFADEAIYVRWAQLMNQDFERWMFFPLQDGKPPLYMWLLRPLLSLAPLDPLLMTRNLNAVIGTFSVAVMGWWMWLLSRSKYQALIAMAISSVLPFTVWHDRLGLLDGMLTLLMGISLIMAYSVRKSRFAVIGLGIGWGLALWTKTSALFWVPLFMLISVVSDTKSVRETLKEGGLKLFLGMSIGLMIFATLRLSPSFANLMNRSSDFTFSPIEVLQGKIDHIPGNVAKIVSWLMVYLSPPLLIMIGVGLFLAIRRQWSLFPTRLSYEPALGLACVLYVLPYILMGRVLYPRYILGIIWFLLPLAVSWFASLKYGISKKIGLVLMTLYVIWAGNFVWHSLTQPENTYLPQVDVEQYLTEWSAGYGIPEVVLLMNAVASNQRLVVATEGFFGTLPDGLLMYFDQSPLITNLEVYGIGQPVVTIPTELQEKADSGETWLVVNEHRWQVADEGCCELLYQFPRPRQGPSLNVWRILP